MLVQSEKARTGVLRPAPQKIRVALIDDHTLVRASLRVLLEQDQAIRVVGDAATASEALEQVLQWNPDVVLLDVFLPDCDGIELWREIQGLCPTAQAVLLSAICNQELVQAAATGGILGYLHKTADLDQVILAIKRVAKAQSYMDSTATTALIGAMRSASNQSSVSGLSRLSLQERRVLVLLADGCTNKEIAVKLGLSDKTVKNYLSHAFEKLHVNRRAEAVAAYLQRYPHPAQS